MKDDPIVALAAAFGPTLKAAFPTEHPVTRLQVAHRLAEIAARDIINRSTTDGK